MAGYNFLFDITKTDFNVVIRDYAEYSGESLDDVVNTIRKSTELASSEWRMHVKNTSDEEIRRFYSCSQYYIYETMQPYLEPKKFKKDKNITKIVRILQSFEDGKVLEFGGGTGQLCLVVYFNTKHKVVYTDIFGKMFQFAQWRFQKYRADIEMIESKVDTIALEKKEYDAIISDAVLEHL